MRARDIVSFTLGVMACAALGLAVTMASGREAPALPRLPVAASERVEAPVVAAAPVTCAEGAAAEALPEGGAYYWDETGRQHACGDACLQGAVEALLSGELSERELMIVSSASEAVGRAIEADPLARRRYLSLLDRIDGHDDERGWVVLGVIHGFSEGLAQEASERLLRSPHAETRPLGLAYLYRLEPETQARLLSRTIGRETDGAVLEAALSSTMMLGEGGLDPSTRAAVHDMARRHAEPKVRAAALQAYVFDQPRSPEARRLVEEALRSELPEARLSAVYALAASGEALRDEAERDRVSGVLRGIADDTGADAELRMAALSMLAYGMEERAWEDEALHDH
jgi:hypothetical protein